jgi:hypothetical protein
VHKPLEEEADRILAEQLKGQTKHSEKADILTPWKLKDRRSREVYVTSGTPDAALRVGIFHRELSLPRLNSRLGHAPPPRRDVREHK